MQIRAAVRARLQRATTKILVDVRRAGRLCTLLLCLSTLVFATLTATNGRALSLGNPTRPKSDVVELKKLGDPWDLMRDNTTVLVTVRYVGHERGTKTPFEVAFTDVNAGMVKQPISVELTWDDGTPLGSFTSTIDWSDRAHPKHVVSGDFTVPQHAWPGDHLVTASASASPDKMTAIVTVPSPKDEQGIQDLSSQLRAGDILLVHGDAPEWTEAEFESLCDGAILLQQQPTQLLKDYMSAWAQQHVFSQYWSHTAIVCPSHNGRGDMRVVEMLPDGIAATSASDWMRKCASKQTFGNAPEEFELVRLHNNSASVDQKDNAAQGALAYLSKGTKYDYGILTSVAAHAKENHINISVALRAKIKLIAKKMQGITNDTDYSLKNDNRQYCSELVWRVFKNAGVVLKDVDPNADEHAFVLPAEVAQMDGIRYIRNGKPKTVAPGGGNSLATSIVIDTSGSMSDPFRGSTKMDETKTGAKDLVTVIDNTAAAQEVSVVGFTTDATVLQSATQDISSVMSAIDALTPEASTNIGAGLEYGLDQLETAPQGASKLLVLLSDGQANEGLITLSDFIDGPVQRAKDAGVKVYCVGFGDPDALNEDLLRAIATETGGTYTLADSKSIGTTVANTFIRAQVASTQNVIGDFEGSVAQDGTTSGGQYQLAQSQSAMQFVLNWPGSVLDLNLKSPSGSMVNSNTPGVTYSNTRPLIVTIDPAQTGTWTAEVFGREVSMEQEPFYLIASYKESTAPAPAPTGGGGSNSDPSGFLLLLAGMGMVGVLGWVVTGASRQQGKRASQESYFQESHSNSEYSLEDYQGREFMLHEGVNTIGRSEDNDVCITEPTVSRTHAEILVSGKHVTIRNVSTTSDVRVNGIPASASELVGGDEIELGSFRLRFTRRFRPMEIR